VADTLSLHLMFLTISCAKPCKRSGLKQSTQTYV